MFAEWYRICEIPGANDATHAHYILQLNQSGLLKGDETSERFFRRLMVIFTYFVGQTLFDKVFKLLLQANFLIIQELSVSHCLSSEVMSSNPQSHQAQPLSFLAIDIYAKLVFSILKVGIFL